MGDEPSKKAGKQPESATLDRLKAELSAGLKTGEDPLYYDWTRVAEAPPSEATYVPPMQIHTQSMDTGDLAAIIGRDAAAAARHAPLPEHKVVIEETGARTDEIEVDFGDAIPTQEMHTPVHDERYAVTRRLVALGQRGRSGWIWVACAIAAVLGCAAFMWTQRGSGPATPADAVPPNDLGAAKQVKGSPAAEAPLSALAASTAPAAAPVPERLADPVAPKLPSEMSPPIGGSLNGQRPEQLPSHRTSGTSRSRPSSPQTVQPKGTGNDKADPIFTDKPNF